AIEKLYETLPQQFDDAIAKVVSNLGQHGSQLDQKISNIATDTDKMVQSIHTVTQQMNASFEKSITTNEELLSKQDSIRDDFLSTLNTSNEKLKSYMDANIQHQKQLLDQLQKAGDKHSKRAAENLAQSHTQWEKMATEHQ